MTGGSIENNRSFESGSGVGYGGGVYIATNGVFTMRADTLVPPSIKGNTAKQGGGVFLTGTNGIFYMQGGTIEGNEASAFGAGFLKFSTGKFHKTGGTIYGNSAVDGVCTVAQRNHGTASDAIHAIEIIQSAAAPKVFIDVTSDPNNVLYTSGSANTEAGLWSTAP
jgi:hypothetical protein